MTSGHMDFDRRAIPHSATETEWRSADGWPLRRFDWPPPHQTKGSMLFLTGRADHYEKYLEAMAHFVASGIHVTSFDWRGQGGSGRLLPDPLIGHIDDFGTWVEDLASFWVEWKAQHPSPQFIIAHSMGGHLTLRALAEARIDPDAVVLCAPMLALRGAGLPSFLQYPLAKLMTAIGDPNRPAWRSGADDGVAGGMRQANLTHDRQRYEDELYWQRERPMLRLGPPSWRWVERAIVSTQRIKDKEILSRVATPVLILAAQYDKLVDFGRITRDAKLLSDCELHSFGREAAHELLREADIVRYRCLALIDDFLARKVLPA